MKAAVLGAGSWGTALAAVLTSNNHDTWLWARNEDIVAEINQQHQNSKYLGAAMLPLQLRATVDVGQVVSDADLVILAVPSVSFREVVTLIQPHIAAHTVIAHAVKGFDPVTMDRMTDVILQVLSIAPKRVCVISGPSHAEEVVAKQPTTIVTASSCKETAEFVQDALMNEAMRVYTNPDVTGAEIGGSLKNIIALGVGIIDGLGIGDNARAALMTRGLAEITRLGVKLGASPLTFAGLSGVGDLIVTCTSQHSRNFRTGRLLGQGATLAEALSQVGMAVEGVQTTKTAVRLADLHGTRMPIAETLYEVLFSGLTPKEAVLRLMKRDRIHEIEEVAQENLAMAWQA